MENHPALDTLTPWQANLVSYIRAGYPILYIQSSEENRVEHELCRAVSKFNEWRSDRPEPLQPLDVYSWDCVQGFKNVNNQNDKKSNGSGDPALALTSIINKTVSPCGMFILRDFDDYMTSVPIRRLMQSIVSQQMLGNSGGATRIIVIVSSKLFIPDKLKQYISVLNFDLPDEKVIHERITFVSRQVKEEKLAGLDESLRTELAQNLTGLTSREIDNALSRSVVLASSFQPKMLPYIKTEKAATFLQGQVLTYIPDEKLPDVEDIGGYDALFDWIREVKGTFTKEAQQNKIDMPRGIGLLGFPGGGKSVCAHGIAKLLGLPFLGMNFASIFGSKVGESEGRMRETLAQIDAQDGSVLLIDEVDKMLGGAADSSGDSGVTQRVFGNLLTWMAEKTSKTFVIFTMNRMDRLPSELTRAGRLDKLWFVDMPDEAARKQILNIHLRKRGVNIADVRFTPKGLESLMRATEHFIGSEVEGIVVSARRQCFAKERRTIPTEEELLDCAKKTISLWSREEAKMVKFAEALEGVATPVAYPPSTKTRKSLVSRQIQ